MYVYDLPFLHSDWQSVKYKPITDRIVLLWQHNIKLKTWRRKPSMAKTITVFTSIPKGLIISSQSTSNWSLLPYRLHHLSHKSLGKTEQTIYFAATPESLWHKADSKCTYIHVHTCIFKCLKGAFKKYHWSVKDNFGMMKLLWRRILWLHFRGHEICT